MSRGPSGGSRDDPGAARFFATPEELRAWLEEHHASRDVLWVGLYKKASGRPSITWPELVDELLCFGWIDGLRKSLGEESYCIRVTPRRPGSVWSAVNQRRVRQLTEEGRMAPPGVAAYGERDPERSGRYSYERARAALDEAQEARFRAHEEAWAFFQDQPPSYRRTAIWWVVSAKREDTRRRRLATLIRDSANGLRIKPLRR